MGGEIPLLEKIALSPLLIMGVLMLAVGLYDADPDTLLPGVTAKFAVACGQAFVEDLDALHRACSLIGALKVLVVLNIWGLRNTRVQLVLAALAVPGFALVIYAHVALGDGPSDLLPAVIFMVLVPRTAFAMLRGEAAPAAATAVEEVAPLPAPASARSGKHKRR